MMKTVQVIGIEKAGAEIALRIIKQNLLSKTKLTIASVDRKYLTNSIRDRIDRSEEYPPFTGFSILTPFEGEVTSDKIRFTNSVFDGKTICLIICADLEEESARRFAPLIALDATLKGMSVISVFSSPDFKYEDSRMQSKLQLTLGSYTTIEQNKDVLKTVSERKYSDPYINLIEGFRMAIDTNRPIKRCTLGPKDSKPLIEIKGHYFHSMTNEQRIKIFDSLGNNFSYTNSLKWLQMAVDRNGGHIQEEWLDREFSSVGCIGEKS